jgi:hypothetical protein
MIVTRTSDVTGKVHTMDLPITQTQLDEWNGPTRPLIQNVFPHLTPDQREFLMTGVTPEEWDELFGDDE